MLTEKKISGVGTALITPFKQDGSVDFAALERIVEHVIVSGVDFLVALGTTGEAPTLDAAEKRAVCRCVADTAAGRVPLVVGIGGNDTLSVVKHIKEADLNGFSYILSVAPYYNKPSQEGLFRHYKTLAENSPLPIIVYNIPSRCGVNIEPKTVLRLAHEVKGIAAVKEASGNVLNIARILKERPEGFSVLSGDDSLTLALMAMGAEGVISTTANLLPGEMAALVRYMFEGNLQGAREVHFKIADIIRMLFEQGNPAGVKAGMNIAGFCENILRLPLVPVDESLYAALAAALERR